MTALPPPMFNPAAAALNVMPRDKRMTSTRASSSEGYGHMRVPPKAGPKVVSWMAITACRPTSDIPQKITCSCPICSIDLKHVIAHLPRVAASDLLEAVLVPKRCLLATTPARLCGSRQFVLRSQRVGYQEFGSLILNCGKFRPSHQELSLFRQLLAKTKAQGLRQEARSRTKERLHKGAGALPAL